MDSSDVRECDYLSLSWPMQSDRRQKFFRPEASWRRMLVQQPPASFAYVEASYPRGDRIFKRYHFPCDASPTTHWVNGHVQRDLIGLRMNMLYDLVLEACLRGPRRHWICWEGHMPPELSWHVLTEQLTPFVERAMKEADVVVVDHWARLRRRRIAPPSLPPCSWPDPDYTVSSHADPTPHSPIETLNMADSDVSRDVSERQSQSDSDFWGLWALKYRPRDWGLEPNPTQVSGFCCLELREEKFIARAESDEDDDDDDGDDGDDDDDDDDDDGDNI